MIDFLMAVFAAHATDDAIVWSDRRFSYGWLLERVRSWQAQLESLSVARGSVVGVRADFSPNSIALFLALVDRECVVVPFTNSIGAKQEEFMAIAECEALFTLSSTDEAEFSATGVHALHPHYATLRKEKHPGLVLFSSGSTGKSKAAVHDLTGLLEKFHVQKQQLRTITFLLYDHIGGVNTMLYTLSNAGCIVTVTDRSPDAVLSAVEKYEVALLPTSPTFINLILLSEAFKRYPVPTLRTVTYGTEPMPESTLRRFHEIYPNVQLQQTYGLSEVGILRSKSKSSDSLWVKVGGEGFETRIVEGMLQIRARSAMLGYLNAPSPFTEDGWFVTGDAVETDGEFIKILGRRSEIINVGGEKVYPAEVESVIQEMPEVAEATVYGEKNPITGQIVCVRITPALSDTDLSKLPALVKQYCSQRMARFKIPVKVVVLEEHQHGDRFKKKRSWA